jgi:hypothetical protein
VRNLHVDEKKNCRYGKDRTVQDTRVAVTHQNKVQRYDVDYSVKRPGGAYDTELAASVAVVRSYLRSVHKQE